MANVKNPLGWRLEEQPERTTGKKDYELVEKDGGRLFCPLKAFVKGKDPGCDTNCVWFFTICNIPERLGVEVPSDE